MPVEPARRPRRPCADRRRRSHRRAVRSPRTPIAITAATTRVTLPDHVLIPGLVNAHTHAAMTLLRGIADDVPPKPWLEVSRSGRARAVSWRRTSSTTARCSARPKCSRGGITCCQRHVFLSRRGRARLRASRHARDARAADPRLPTPYAADADALPARGLAARDAFKHASRAVRFRSRRMRRTRCRTRRGVRSSCTRASSICRSRRTSPETKRRGRRRARRDAR
mgnify:CR=1 FL=1